MAKFWGQSHEWLRPQTLNYNSAGIYYTAESYFLINSANLFLLICELRVEIIHIDDYTDMYWLTLIIVLYSSCWFPFFLFCLNFALSDGFILFRFLDFLPLFHFFGHPSEIFAVLNWWPWISTCVLCNRSILLFHLFWKTILRVQ